MRGARSGGSRLSERRVLAGEERAFRTEEGGKATEENERARGGASEGGDGGEEASKPVARGERCAEAHVGTRAPQCKHTMYQESDHVRSRGVRAVETLPVRVCPC